MIRLSGPADNSPRKRPKSGRTMLTHAPDCRKTFTHFMVRFHRPLPTPPQHLGTRWYLVLCLSFELPRYPP